ncbi:MAG TPA: hypothetical protein VN939_01380 [Chthoniobacterales bacterium]|jgi:ATP-dependent DNA ligase|nr:hypothetical protein [Chthoniobacterales bacterium]
MLIFDILSSVRLSPKDPWAAIATPVCEVEYAELPTDHQLRQTTFLGWRDDKKAKEVVLEQSQIV